MHLASFTRIRQYLQLPYLLLTFILIPLSGLPAQVEFDENVGKLQLYPHSEILEIEKGKVEISDLITNPESFAFKPTEDQLIEMRCAENGYWIKSKIRINTIDHSYILIPHYGTDIIQFYQVNNSKIINQARAGVGVKLSEHNIENSRAIFELVNNPGDISEIYLYLEGHNLPGLPYYVISSQEIIETSYRDDLFNGIMYGLMILIFIYNIILFIQIRERDNLLYAIWVILLTIQFSIYKGLATRFIWPEWVEINKYADAFFATTAIVFMLFTFVFLKLKKVSKPIYQVGLGILAIYVVLIVLILTGSADSFYSKFNVGTLTLIQGIWSIIAGVYCYRKGFKPAIYYVIANLLLFVSIFIFFGYAFGAIEHSFVTYNVMHLGAGLQIIFFSIALSNKINLFKKDKELAEKQKIKLLQENERLVSEQNLILEAQVKERTKQLRLEKSKSDDLLKNILPEEVAEELKAKGSSQAKRYESTTILFTDFKGFTSISRQLEPEEIVSTLNTCFTEFDKIMEKHGIEKIKTIGDAYMAACGLPIPNEKHAIQVVKAAIELKEFLNTFNRSKGSGTEFQFQARIGIHSGPVVAGIVGQKKFAYDIWGDTVNIASRMESSGEVGKINISKSTYELVKDDFKCIPRGMVEIKGGTSYEMYFIEAPIQYKESQNI